MENKGPQEVQETLVKGQFSEVWAGLNDTRVFEKLSPSLGLKGVGEGTFHESW